MDFKSFDRASLGRKHKATKEHDMQDCVASYRTFCWIIEVFPLAGIMLVIVLSKNAA